MEESFEIETLDQVGIKAQIQVDLIYFNNGKIYERYACPVMDEDKITGRLFSYRDITDKKKVEEQLKIFATRDDLTGLMNRRYFMERGEMAFKQGIRYGFDMALVEIDIDYFKNVNDTYGHAAGDEGLKFVAKALNDNLRETDLVGRIGGEEFAIFLNTTDPKLVMEICEKIRKYFLANTFVFEDKVLRITISLGAACYNSKITTLDEFLAVADRACYKAKAIGRNKTVLIQ